MTKIAGSGTIIQRHGSADPVSNKNGMDPQHWVRPCRVTKYVLLYPPLLIV
jgi:hypothetical protein